MEKARQAGPDLGQDVESVTRMRRSLSSRWFLGLGVLLLLVLSSACGEEQPGAGEEGENGEEAVEEQTDQGEGEDETPPDEEGESADAEFEGTVKLYGASSSVQPYHGFLFLGVDEALGYFDHQGIGVEFGSAGGSAAAIQLVGTGEVDMAYVGMSQLVVSKESQPDLPVKAVYLQDVGNIYEVVVPKDSGITSLEDLKGKNVGVANLASGTIPVLRAMLAEAGLDPNADVGLIPVGYGAQALSALDSGRVEALALFRAQHAILETLGREFTYFTKDLPSAVIVANTDFIEQYPDAVTKTLQGLVLNTVFAQAAPEETVRTYWDMFGQPTDMSEEEALENGVHVLTSTGELWKSYEDDSTEWGAMDDATWDKVQDFMVQEEMIEEKLPNETLYTSEFIPEVNEVDISVALEDANAN